MADFRAPAAVFARSAPLALLQSAAQVVDSIVGMAWIDDLEDHIVARFELADHRVILVFGAGGLFVDADNHQSGFKALLIGKRAGANRLNDDSGAV